MRFLDKFDLQDLATAGPLKVYEALESQTGLRRLVQILEWKDVPAEVTTLQILEHFGQTAPEPPGIILDAGRVEKTNQVYLVTSFPDDRLSVEKWLNTYLARVNPAKTRVDAPYPTRISPSPTPSLPVEAGATRFGKRLEEPEREPSLSRHEPGAFTKEFLALLDGSGKVADERPAVPDSQETKAPGAFTREFLSLSSSVDQGQDKPSVGAPAEAPGLLADAEGPSPGAPPQAPAPGKRTGEFTRFFRAYTDAPSKTPPAFSPTADVFGTADQESGQAPRGEFTNFFGPGKAASREIREGPIASTHFGSEESPVAPRFDYDPAPPAFSSRDSATLREPAMPPLNPRETRPAFLEPAWDGQPPASPDSTSRGAPAARPQGESQAPRRNSFEPKWGESSGDTQLIAPQRTQESPPAAVDEGPSEFTRVISSASLRAAPPSPNPPAVPPPAAPSIQGQPLQPPSIQPPSIQAPSVQPPSMQPNFASVAAPPVAAGPAVTMPVAPQVPSAPNLPVMQSPAVPAPAPPASQPAPAPAPKLVSYLPLIITLNVLLAVVIAVVLYFALKSHH